MKHASSHFLRLSAIGITGLILLLSGLILNALYFDWAKDLPDIAWVRYPFMAVIITTLFPFFVALSQAWKLLGLLDKGKAFSAQSVRALANIKYSTLVMAFIHGLFLPCVYIWAQEEDAPGLVIIGMIFTAIPMVLGVFAGVLQKLIQGALDLKSENDLTV